MQPLPPDNPLPVKRFLLTLFCFFSACQTACHQLPYWRQFRLPLQRNLQFP